MATVILTATPSSQAIHNNVVATTTVTPSGTYTYDYTLNGKTYPNRPATWPMTSGTTQNHSLSVIVKNRNGTAVGTANTTFTTQVPSITILPEGSVSISVDTTDTILTSWVSHGSGYIYEWQISGNSNTYSGNSFSPNSASTGTHTVTLTVKKESNGATHTIGTATKTVSFVAAPRPLDTNRYPKSISVEKTYHGLIRPMSGVDRSYEGDSGADIAAAKGTPIYAAASGTLRYSYYDGNDAFSPNKGYPNDTPYRVRIKLDTPIVFEGTTYCDNFYTHLSGIVRNKGRNEDKKIHVRQGELIGYCGSGRHNMHLHFAVYTDFSSNEKPIRAPKIQTLFSSKYGDKWIAGK